MTRLTEHPKVRKAILDLNTNYPLWSPDALVAAVVSALAETELEEAAKAMADEHGFDFDRMAEQGLSSSVPTFISKGTFRRFAQRAAPFLTAPLRAELARVREERDGAQTALRLDGVVKFGLHERAEKAEREAASLREALGKYGKHSFTCDAGSPGGQLHGAPCTCGLDAALGRANG